MSDERLHPLADKFGPLAVWFASVECLGFPPWDLRTDDVLKIVSFLESSYKKVN